MSTTVRTSTSIAATRGGRLHAVDSAGVDWVAVYDLAITRWTFWYSSNDGATWTENANLQISASATNICGSFVISDNDWAWFATSNGTNFSFMSRTTSALTSTSTWVSPAHFTFDLLVNGIDLCVAKRTGTPTYYTACIASQSGNQYSRMMMLRVDATTLGTTQNTPVIFNPSGSAQHQIAIDWSHAGDGKTASGVPSIFVVGRNNAGGTSFKRFTEGPPPGIYSTEGTERVIDAANAPTGRPLTGIFDGSRFVMAFTDSNPAVVKWYERDAADTTTTSRTPPALNDGDITSLSVAVANAAANARLYAVGTTSDDVRRLNYNRALGTFDTWTLIEASTATVNTMSVQRGYQGDGHGIVWTTGASSPYTILRERDPLNTAPTAPTWTAPGDNSAQNVAATLLLDWQFNDPDDGDTQSAYALSRSVNGGALQYLNATAGTWGASEVKNDSTSTQVTLATAWATDGQSTAYKVKTWDAADLPGPYGSALTIVGSTLVVPVVTAPANGALLTGPTVTVTWTATEQTAYRIRLLTSADVVLYTSGKITDTPTRSVAVPFVLANGLTDIKVEVSTWNNEDLVATGVVRTGIDVTYTPPLAPTLTVTANNAGGFMSVAMNDPAFGPTPQVASHDIFVRVAAGGRPDEGRPVGGDGIRIATGIVEDGTWLDYAAGIGIDYQYRTLTTAVTGAVVFSAWT